MAALPVEVVYGLYFGVLTGLVPAAVAWLLGFGFRYVTGVTVPGLAVVVLSVAIAGASGGLMALADPTITQSESQVRLTVALLVVLMGSLYAHNRGDAFANEIPRKVSLRKLTERTLSTDVVELVGGRGQVRVAVAGEVGNWLPGTRCTSSAGRKCSGRSNAGRRWPTVKQMVVTIVTMRTMVTVGVTQTTEGTGTRMKRALAKAAGTIGAATATPTKLEKLTAVPTPRTASHLDRPGRNPHDRRARRRYYGVETVR